MIYNRKMLLVITEDEVRMLDAQSKKCNWLYNHLLQTVIDDYKNGNQKKLLNGRNLRNLVPSIKEENPFLKTVHSSPLKNSALRLKDAFNRFFKKGNGFPKFRSWKKKWFSLYYDEPNKGFKLQDKNLKITFGKNEESKQLSITVILKEKLVLSKDAVIKTLRITKDHNRYYAIFTIKEPGNTKTKNLSWIAFDPNHKNLMIGIDNYGVSYEVANLPQIKYWDRVIDRLKSKRDLRLCKAKFVVTYEGRGYWEPSKRWKRINKALDKAYNARREQIKQALYALGNWLAKQYHLVLLGDYTPTLGTAKFNKMHRSMLNQTVIAQARKIIAWVQEKSGKCFKKVVERNTTKTCCLCGHQEKKAPNVRVFTCANCQETLSRDLNSAINIARKENLLPCLGYVGDLSRTTYTVSWNYTRCNLKVQTN